MPVHLLVYCCNFHVIILLYICNLSQTSVFSLMYMFFFFFYVKCSVDVIMVNFVMSTCV